MKRVVIIVLTFLILLVTTPSWAQNRVLSLDGEGDYVEIEDSEALNDIGFQVTVETWIKPTSFAHQWVAIIFKGDEQAPNYSNRSFALWLNSSGSIYLISAPEGQGQIPLNSPDGLIRLNKWYHLAGVIDATNGVMRIFINGAEVANRGFPRKEFHVSRLPLRIGWTHEEKTGTFAGQIDEIRIWNVARTEEQIADNIFKPLRGDEPGLVTYWQFEGGNGIINDVTGNGNDGKLIGDATRVVSELPSRDELHQTYLSSLKLELTVRRIKPSELSDVLVITARRVPQSSAFTTSQIPVRIDIQDESSELLAQLQSQIGKSVNWKVPDEVKGSLRIVAKHSLGLGTTDEASFACRAHSTIPVTKKVGHFQTYDVTDGLGGSLVTSIVQDRRGFLWFGLQGGGVSRYDGRTFHTFTVEDGLPSDYVWKVFEDSKGNLWIGTYTYFVWQGAGVCRYDGETFQTYTTEDGLVSNVVFAICEDESGHLWFGTESGVSEFDGAIFRNYTREDGLPTGRVGSITQDQGGCLWFGHGVKASPGGNGATRYDGKSFRHFNTADGLIHNAVTSIATDTHGNLWFGTWEGISKYDGKSFTNFTVQDGLLDNFIQDICQTRNGELWFATWGGGVSQYQDGTFNNFTTQDGLADDLTLCVLEDSEGDLWLGTWDGGLSRYDRAVESIPVSINMEPIRDKRGNLWFFIPNIGLGRYDGRNLRTFAVEDGLLDIEVRDICEDNRGNIWIGSVFGGLSKYDGQTFQVFTTQDGLISNSVWTICEDREGVLWIGTGGGICTYDGKKFETVADREELGNVGSAGDILEDSRGNMWFALIQGGIVRYNGVEFTKFTTADGLAGNTGYASQLAEDKEGNIWIPTVEGGISYYDGQQFYSYSTQDGLTGNRVGRAFEASNGKMWFAIEAGGFHNFDGRNFQSFTIDDGLLSNSAKGILEDEVGNMFFCTSSGITIYTPPKEGIPPPVWVTEVVADRLYTSPSELQISSTAKRISFAYYGMSFKTRRMRYNYMLQGYDTDWIATWDEQASYDNLKPGDYTFKVIAINRDLVYSDTPATVSLKIVPPFYFRTVFIVPTAGFGTILIALLTILSIGYVKRRQQLREAERQLIIQERMASLGNLVAGVAHEMNNPIGAIHGAADVANRGLHQIQTLSQKYRNVDESAEDAEQMQRSLKLIERNNQVITMASTRIAKVVESLRKFARLDEATFQKASIHEGIEITLTLLQYELQDKVTVIKEYGDIPPIMCYPSELNQVFMHLLRNAIQAIEQKGTIKITTASDDTHVTVSISDTGKGIPPENLEKIFEPGFTTKSGGVGISLGLSIVYNIIQKHQGDIKVLSKVGEGTEFLLALPIEQTS